jgi:hypothetical protein
MAEQNCGSKSGRVIPTSLATPWTALHATLTPFEIAERLKSFWTALGVQPRRAYRRSALSCSPPTFKGDGGRKVRRGCLGVEEWVWGWEEGVLLSSRSVGE